MPRLPALEEMIANARADKTTLRIQSPNSLMGMFDALDGPFGENWHGKFNNVPLSRINCIATAMKITVFELLSSFLHILPDINVQNAIDIFMIN